MRTFVRWLFFVSLALMSRATAASKAQTYVVQPGDSIAKIADHFGVSQSDLMDANDIRDALSLQPGQELVIPDELRGGSRGHVVKKGDTLVRLAKRYKVSVKDIREFNKLADGESLRLGRTLLIPDTESIGSTGMAKSKGRAPVVLLRWQTGQSAKVYLTSKGGGVNQKARKILSELAAPRKTITAKGQKTKKSATKLLHPRLVQLLSRVAERYPGRAIQIISGYRPHKKGKQRSKHAEGRALDFRVEGVANRELYEFIRTLPKAGTGYYPHSSFVHLDARDQSATWTDYSGPGQPAQYRKPSAEAEAMADAESVSEDPPDPASVVLPSPEDATEAAQSSDETVKTSE